MIERASKLDAQRTGHDRILLGRTGTTRPDPMTPRDPFVARCAVISRPFYWGLLFFATKALFGS